MGLTRSREVAKNCAHGSGLCGFVRAPTILRLTENFTSEAGFIYCDLCPQAAVILPLWGASRGPSVTFQIVIH